MDKNFPVKKKKGFLWGSIKNFLLNSQKEMLGTKNFDFIPIVEGAGPHVLRKLV